MEYPISYPGFEGRGLAVRVPGLFSDPRLLVDGAEVKGKRHRYEVRDNQGAATQIRLKLDFFDAVPKVEIGGKVIKPAPPLPWHAYACSALPLLLALIGGLLGALCGLPACIVNARIFRRDMETSKKYLLTGLVSVAAFVLYVVVAGTLYVMMGGQ